MFRRRDRAYKVAIGDEPRLEYATVRCSNEARGAGLVGAMGAAWSLRTI